MYLDDYEPLYEISCSAVSQVYAARRYDSGQEVIMKVLEGEDRKFGKHGDMLLPEEILIHKSLNHPNIQKWLEFFFESGVWFIVFEHDPDFCTLSDYISQHGPLSEPAARDVLDQLLDTVTFCHLHGVDPRNLNLDNILINPANLTVKLYNFEGAVELQSAHCHRDAVENSAYLPPEYFMSGKYLPLQGTVWALGCVLFETVFARRPLFVTESDFKLLEVLFSKVSGDCIRFLKDCLCPLPDKRIRFEELRENVWLSSEIQI